MRTSWASVALLCLLTPLASSEKPPTCFDITNKHKLKKHGYGSDQCAFAKDICDDDGYSEAYYCSSAAGRRFFLVACAFWLGLLFRILASTADDYFSPALEQFSTKLGLPPRFAGVTLLALGNGAPDVSATISAINKGGDGYLMSLGALTGAGMFVGTVVAGSVMVEAKGVQAKGALIRDAAMYCLTCGMTLWMFQSGTMTFANVHALLLSYLAFISVVLIADVYHRAVVVPREKARKARVRAASQSAQASGSASGYGMEWQLGSGGGQGPAGIEMEDMSGVLGAMQALQSTFEHNGHGTVTLRDREHSPDESHEDKFEEEVGGVAAGDSTTGLAAGLPPVAGPGGGGRDGDRGVGSAGGSAAAISRADPGTAGRLRRSVSGVRSHRARYLIMHADDEDYSPLDMSEPRDSSTPTTVMSPLAETEHDRYVALEDATDPGMASSRGSQPFGGSRIGGGVEATMESLMDDRQELSVAARVRYEVRCGFEEFKEMPPLDKCLYAAEWPFAVARRLTVPITAEDNYKKPWLLLSVFLCPLWLIGFYLEGAPEHSIGGGMPVLVLSLCASGSVAAAVHLACSDRSPPPLALSAPLALLGFAIAATWIDAVADQLVNLLTFLGNLLAIPEPILGLTVLAWGNSIGDYATNMAMAKKGLANMAMTACFAGPVFNMLVGTGLGWLLLLQKKDEPGVKADGSFEVSLSPGIIVGFCCIMLNCVAIGCFGIFNKNFVPKEYGYASVTMYLFYLVISFLLLYGAF